MNIKVLESAEKDLEKGLEIIFLILFTQTLNRYIFMRVFTVSILVSTDYCLKNFLLQSTTEQKKKQFLYMQFWIVVKIPCGSVSGCYNFYPVSAYNQHVLVRNLASNPKMIDHSH
jgi:hypothetical protein